MSLGLSTSHLQTPQTGFSILQKYTDMSQIGSGSYSKVFKAKCRTTKMSVAIKIIDTDLDEGLSAVVMREISLLKELRHKNIIALIECEGIETRTALVLEHCPGDLETYMTQRRLTGRPLHSDPYLIRTFMWQLLQGLAYCHAKKVLHRDLKPQNLLVDKHGVLKIADFGLARQVGFHPESENLTGDVVTLWYRAPELLQPPTPTPTPTPRRYGCAIDVWSCGCILAEMVLDHALFGGVPDASTLLRYIKSIPMCGIQTFLVTYHPHQGQWPPHAINLLHCMLQYDAKSRITVMQALEHPYFRGRWQDVGDATSTKNLAPLDTLNLRPAHQGQMVGVQQLPQAVPRIPNRPLDGRTQPGSVRAMRQGQTGKPYKVGAGAPSFRTLRDSSQAANHDFSMFKKYTNMIQIGTPSASTIRSWRVFDSIRTSQAQCGTTKRPVAIKVTNARLSEGLNRGVIREITLLKELSHPNIIELIECETIEAGTALVLEHCPYDLAGYIEQRRSAGRPLDCDPTQMRTFMSQLLVGVAHCHAKNVLHRDLKPQNLLIDSQGVLKIADFGLARQIGFQPGSENLKNLVVTLRYRAPELVNASTATSSYGAAIDVWSCGCIFAEMIVGRQLFCWAEDEQSLLQYIRFIPAYGIQAFLRTYHENLGQFPPHVLDLLHRMLQYDPKTRITAADALDHLYFPARWHSARDAMPPIRDLAPLDAFKDPQGQTTSGLQQLQQPAVIHMPSRPPGVHVELGSFRDALFANASGRPPSRAP
ncbi:hypothetical protein VTO73DRAFT_4440 [Trametes versicolor]